MHDPLKHLVHTRMGAWIPPEVPIQTQIMTLKPTANSSFPRNQLPPSLISTREFSRPSCRLNDPTHEVGRQGFEILENAPWDGLGCKAYSLGMVPGAPSVPKP